MFPKVIKSKRFVATATIAIIACSALFWITTSNNSLFYFFVPNDEAKNGQNSLFPSRGNNNGIDKDYYLRGSAALNETAYAEVKQLSVKNERYLCGTPFPSSTQYMEEYYIPLTCTQPVGITVDSNDKIWFVATWSGYLVVFDPICDTLLILSRFQTGKRKEPLDRWFGAWNSIKKVISGLQTK